MNNYSLAYDLVRMIVKGRVGKLVLVNRKTRMGRNPATGAAIKIPAKRVLKFQIGNACKDAVLGAKKIGDWF